MNKKFIAELTVLDMMKYDGNITSCLTAKTSLTTPYGTFTFVPLVLATAKTTGGVAVAFEIQRVVNEQR